MNEWIKNLMNKKVNEWVNGWKMDEWVDNINEVSMLWYTLMVGALVLNVKGSDIESRRIPLARLILSNAPPGTVVELHLKIKSCATSQTKMTYH